MTTATEIVTAALGKLLVRSADVPLEADELQDGIAALNRMMAAWNLSALSWTAVTSGSDTIASPAYAEDAQVFDLAQRLAPDYGVALNPALVIARKEAMNEMRRQAITIGRASYPSTLPQGSGNDRGLNNRSFYPPSTAETT